MPGDWELWRRYLLLNDSVHVVAAEFQTGNRKRDQGIKLMDRIKWLECEVGRKLHPVAIGASQFAAELGARFPEFTIIDSEPFMKAIKRQRFEMGVRRPSWHTEYLLPGTGIEGLLMHNLREYSSWISHCAQSLRSKRRRIRGSDSLL
jgi:hypothetical protein